MMSGRNVDFLMSNAARWWSGSVWSSGLSAECGS